MASVTFDSPLVVEKEYEFRTPSKSEAWPISESCEDLSADRFSTDYCPTSERTSEDHIDASIRDDWSGNGSHVDFDSKERIPLERGRYLGHGAVGEVFEARCRGTVLAVKQRSCRKKITEAEMREIDILKRLSHHHVVQIIGTYTQPHPRGYFLGILLHPVAVCDLATFFDDFESVYSGMPLEPQQIERLSELGLPLPLWKQGSRPECAFLLAKIGCITGAIKYLHSKHVRHRDLKPSNILLSRRRVWITDFNSSTDFSSRSTSQTESGDRGTPKYFAPEVARHEVSGRASDVFSLGCVFLEILTLCLRGSLTPLQALRPNLDHCNSFQANLSQMGRWMGLLDSDVPLHRHVAIEIVQMLAENPEVRPTTHDLYRRLAYIDQFGGHNELARLFDNCCRSTFYSEEHHRRGVRRLNDQIQDLRKDNQRLQREFHDHRQNMLLNMERQRNWELQFADETAGLVETGQVAAAIVYPYNRPHHGSLSRSRVLLVVVLVNMISLTFALSGFAAYRTGKIRLSCTKGIVFSATVLTSMLAMLAMICARRALQEALLAGLLLFLIGFSLISHIEEFM